MSNNGKNSRNPRNKSSVIGKMNSLVDNDKRDTHQILEERNQTQVINPSGSVVMRKNIQTPFDSDRGSQKDIKINVITQKQLGMTSQNFGKLSKNENKLLLPEINRNGQKNKNELLESNLPQEIIKNIEGQHHIKDHNKPFTSEAFEM